MIILFDEHEREFTSLGLGILKDATNCIVKEEINGAFTLEMSYDISGDLYSQIKINNIIFTKPNPYDDPQPFRIDTISKPIKGIIKVTAKHLSYDMNYIPTKPIDGKSLQDVLNQIQNGKLKEENGVTKRESLVMVPNRFKFTTDITTGKTFKTTQPFNLRAILMGDEEESLLGVYNAEVKFDKFVVKILSKRGKNRGAQVRYGHNMTDITHDASSEKLYNGVFPYYHKEKTSNETVTEDTFKQVYIVGSKPFVDGWLSFSEGGEPYHPLDEGPVQIATEGEYFEKVYCWNSTYQRFEEKLYNETVTLIENAITPGWIAIDWKSFPTIKCVANAKGYYKLMTDTDWGQIKGPGDVIFEGNILKEGISGIASNMIIYYSEVIPSGSQSENKEVTEVIDVQLDDPIIYLNTIDAKSMTHDKILMLDLSSEFDEEPTQDKLRAKAEEYISKNKIGSLYTTTKVSYIDLQKTSEHDIYKNFDHVELGDTVQIIHNELGINTELRVISTEYNVLADMYNNVELGVKEKTLSSQSIETGDKISSLSNDVGYADITTVNKLIANTVTAEFLNAVNAKLSVAQIEELSVSKINCPGIIEASQYSIDNLVAKLLTADNAVIKNVLEAGEIKVAGDITIKKGSIDIYGDDSSNTFFTVDKNGNLKANSVNITGGELKINDGIFQVDNDGTLHASNAHITGEVIIDKGSIKLGEKFEVTNDGKLTADEANINGNIIITSGSIKLGNNFEVDTYGNVTAKNINVTGGTFNLGYNSSKGDYNFKVDSNGSVTIGYGSININNNFKVDAYGNLEANSVKLSDGTFLGQVKIGGTYATEPIISMSSYDDIVFSSSLEANMGIITKDFSVSSFDTVRCNDVWSDYRLSSKSATFYARINNDLPSHLPRGLTSVWSKIVLENIYKIAIVTDPNAMPNGSRVLCKQKMYISSNPYNVVDSQLGRYYHPNGYLQDIDLGSRFRKPSVYDTRYYPTCDITVNAKIKYINIDDVTKEKNVLCTVPRYFNSGTNFPNDYIVSDIIDDNIKEIVSFTIIDPEIFIPHTFKRENEYYDPSTEDDYINMTIDTDFLPLYMNSYNLGSPTIKWNNVYANNLNGSVSSPSDRRLKKNIDYDFSKYDKFFDLLKPATFNFISDKNEHIHFGLIAQDVYENLNSEYSDKKFDLVQKTDMTDNNKYKHINDNIDIPEEDSIYSLKYEEFISLLVYEVQQLKAKIKILEGEK